MCFYGRKACLYVWKPSWCLIPEHVLNDAKQIFSFSCLPCACYIAVKIRRILSPRFKKGHGESTVLKCPHGILYSLGHLITLGDHILGGRTRFSLRIAFQDIICRVCEAAPWSQNRESVPALFILHASLWYFTFAIMSRT